LACFCHFGILRFAFALAGFFGILFAFLAGLLAFFGSLGVLRFAFAFALPFRIGLRGPAGSDLGLDPAFLQLS
jgi:hypothetical protein